MKWTWRVLATPALLSLLLSGVLGVALPGTVVTDLAGMMVRAPTPIAATVETDPVPHGGDAADDPAIWVNAADLIDLRGYDAALDQRFRAWLSAVRTEELDGKTLVSTHEERPNNWGTHAGAARVAADMYLGDNADLARAAQVFAGWLGDRSAYAGFTYGDLSWQADPSKSVGINGKGATRDGHPIDGVLPDDQRRAGGWSWPPPKENYVWEGLQGAIVQAELLRRAGYDVFLADPCLSGTQRQRWLALRQRALVLLGGAP